MELLDAKDCPNCGHKGLSILKINDYCYVKSCSKCDYNIEIPLPKLNKKIIYLDQFVYSKIYSAQSGVKGMREDEVNKWKEIYCLLKKLCNTQLIVCPKSQFHEVESSLILYPDKQEGILKIVENLSMGIEFRSADDIETVHIDNSIRSWLCNKPTIIHKKMVFNKDITKWPQRSEHNILMNITKYMINDYKTSKLKIQSLINEYIKMVNSNKREKSYNEQYNTIYNEIMKGHAERGDLPYFNNIIMLLIMNGVNAEEVNDKLAKFLDSRESRKTMSMQLYIKIIMQLGKMGDEVNRGMANDISIISLLSSFCDCMVIDNKMRETMKQIKTVPKTTCEFYSEKNMDYFIEKLKTIECEADKDITKKAIDIYGE